MHVNLTHIFGCAICLLPVLGFQSLFFINNFYCFWFSAVSIIIISNNTRHLYEYNNSFSRLRNCYLVKICDGRPILLSPQPSSSMCPGCPAVTLHSLATGSSDFLDVETGVCCGLLFQCELL